MGRRAGPRGERITVRPLAAGEPQNIGEYRLLGRLGSGGTGRVYLGRGAGGRTVAVEIVHPHFALDEEFRARFRREVAAARRVGGSWTAPVLAADPDAPVPWVATGYLAGPSLTQAVAAHGPLPEFSVRARGAGLAEALTAVHALGPGRARAATPYRRPGGPGPRPVTPARRPLGGRPRDPSAARGTRVPLA